MLRLLASGHTVKSIAAQLGRSEPSINERLRDARRKTGVGSSRELARLLAAQKNRDRNIGLAPTSPAIDAVEQPASDGPTRSKGAMIMLIAIPLAAAAGLTFAAIGPASQPNEAVATHAAVAKPSPLVGRWSLDVMRIPEQERPRRVTIDFRMSADQKWTTRVEILAADGTAMQSESTAAADGKPVAGTGNMPFVDTVALRQPAPGTLVMTLGKGGTPVSTRVYTVSKDGKTMTETIIWASTGIPKLETTYFNRIG